MTDTSNVSGNLGTEAGLLERDSIVDPVFESIVVRTLQKYDKPGFHEGFPAPTIPSTRHPPHENPIVRTTFVLLALTTLARADPPGTAYVFPAGGQRGTTVDVRIGGLNLHETARLHVLGDGVAATPEIERTDTIWFEGPLVRLPASQKSEDYPRDYRGRFTFAADAPGTPARWHVSNSQGVTVGRAFVVGDLSEIVEHEIDGDPLPVPVELPVTINGRIFPREDVDVWTFDLAAGETVTCEVNAARLGSPLDSRLELRDPAGRLVAENVDALGNDSRLEYRATEPGTHAVRIHDVAFNGLQDHVYRLTITTGPWVEAVYPLGGHRGETVSLRYFGANVPAAPVDVALPVDGDDHFLHRPTFDDAASNVVALEVGDLPEHLEVAERHANAFTFPAILNGRIETPGDSDDWTFDATKGEKLLFDLRAASLGSPLDSVLSVIDATGKTLATSDDRAAGETDSRLPFTVPADGPYTLHVEERFTTRGGPRFAYRVHVTGDDAAVPFQVEFPTDALVVTRGQPTKVPVTVTRSAGFQGTIELRLAGLPEGVTVEGTTLPAKKPKATLLLHAADTLPVQLAHVTATAVATIDDAEVSAPVFTSGPSGETLSNVLLAVAIPTPFMLVADFESKYAPLGSVHERSYRIERSGYDGPLEVRLADVQARHLQGVTGPSITVPAGATSFKYPVQLGPRMEIGRTSRTCLVAVANVTDFDGSPHTVCFSSIAQNEQVIVLTDPARLFVAPLRRSLVAAPSATVEVPIRLTRGNGLTGPVEITGHLAEHVTGVTVAPLVVDEHAESGTLTLTFARTPGPFNTPLVVRATLPDERGRPVTAEATIELVPAE